MKSIRLKLEVLMLLEKQGLAAARNQAVYFPLGTFSEAAEPSEIAVSARLQNEYLDLMMRHADVFIAQQVVEGTSACFLKLFEATEIVQPHGQIYVFALMPDRHTRSTKASETRDFFPRRPCDRAEKGHPLDSGMLRERLGDPRCRPSKMLPPKQLVRILPFDFRL